MFLSTWLARLKSLVLLTGLLPVAAQATTPPQLAALAPGGTFTANKNQWEKPVLFAANVPGGRLFLTPGRLVQALYDVAAVEEAHDKATSETQLIKAHAYSVTFVGANTQAAVQGEELRSANTNYFLGNDPRKWATNVPAYGAVRYQTLYPGTDLRFYSRENQLEYDFELAAGADASRIRLRYDGQEQLQIKDGALHIATSVGTVVEQQPYAYQLRDGQPEPVACAYVLGPQHTVSFAFPQGYDWHRPLIIDPVLAYSTYSGSNASNWGYSSTYDAQGNLYCGGISFGLGFPTTMGAYSVRFGGVQDMTIMKYNPSATSGIASLLYSTFIGGTLAEHPHSLLVDNGGNLLIYGSTSSLNYPTTPGAYDTSFNGSSDIVVTRLNPTGSALLASTFVGGGGVDGQLPSSSSQSVLFKNHGDSFRGDITLDRSGNVYIASNTQSSNFPRIGGVQSLLSGNRDAAVFKLMPSLGGLQWSTFLGGPGEDAAYSIQVDSLSNVFVCGGTTSLTFPGTTGGLRPSYSGGITDGFVTCISASGNILTQSTYLGTSGYDQAYFVQLDRQGDLYILGQTDGFYPVSAGVYNNPNSMQFIHKMRSNLTMSMWSTVIGNGRVGLSTTNISPTAFLVDNCGQILISGYGSNISNMPVTPDALKPFPTNPSTFSSVNGDFHIMQLSANAGRLVYGTYFGDGTLHVDGGASRFDKSGAIYQTACAISAGSIAAATTTPNAWSRSPGFGARNALSFKIEIGQLNASFLPANSPGGATAVRRQCAPAQFYFNRTSVTGTRIRWDFGNGQSSTVSANASASYTIPGTYLVRLTVFDSTNCLQSVSAVDTVQVYPRPVASAGPNRTICQGNSVELTAANTGLIGTTYQWSPPVGLNTTTGPQVTARPTSTTTYTLTVNSPGGCSAQTTVEVRVNPVPQAQPGVARREVFTNSPLAFANNSVNATSYVWTFGDGQSSTEATPTHTFLQPGTYQVRLVASAGSTMCQDEKTLIITVRQFELPNIITPNGDQKNDTFRPVVSFAPLSVKIYNRWGRLVYEKNNFVDSWGGADTADGVYYYHLTDANGVSWKGWVEVAH